MHGDGMSSCTGWSGVCKSPEMGTPQPACFASAGCALKSAALSSNDTSSSLPSSEEADSSSVSLSMPHLRRTLADAPSKSSRLRLSEAERARRGVLVVLWVGGVPAWELRLRGGLEGVTLVGPKAGIGAGTALGCVGGKGGGKLAAVCGTYTPHSLFASLQQYCCTLCAIREQIPVWLPETFLSMLTCTLHNLCHSQCYWMLHAD